MRKKYLSGMISKTIVLSVLLCIVVIGIMIFADKMNAGTWMGINLQHGWFSLIGTCVSAIVSINVPIYVMVQTLRYQKENADKELRLRIMPIFKYEFLFDEKVPEEKRGGLTLMTKDDLDFEDSMYHYGLLRITNTGIGHAKDCVVNFKRQDDEKEQSIWFGSVNMQDAAEFCFVILTEKEVEKAELYNFQLEVRYKDYADNEYIQRIVVDCGHIEHYDEYDNCTLQPHISNWEPDNAICA